MIPKMLVVIDTNVIVSALKSSSGASFQLILMVRKGLVRPAVSIPLVFEYDDVANRPDLLPHLTPSEIKAFLDWFVSVSSHQKVHFLWRPLLRDPKDDMVLEAAVAAGVDCLITHNLSDFDGASSLGIRVLTPSQFPAFFSPTPSPTPP